MCMQEVLRSVAQEGVFFFGRKCECREQSSDTLKNKKPPFQTSFSSKRIQKEQIARANREDTRMRGFLGSSCDNSWEGGTAREKRKNLFCRLILGTMK